MAVGDALEFARVSAGLSITELASALQISPRVYLRIVAGDRAITFRQALLAADALAITTAELAEFVEQSLGSWLKDRPLSHDEVRRIGRRRLYRLLVRLEREDRVGAGRAREWLERRYRMGADGAHRAPDTER